MDIKATFLILLNLFLIEIISSFPNAVIIGSILSAMPGEWRKKRFYIVVISNPFIRSLILLFVSLMVRFPMLLGNIVILYLSLFYFMFFNIRSQKKISLFMLIIVVVDLLSIDIIGIDTHESVFTPVAFTNNIYIIMVGLTIGVLSFSIITYWVMVCANRLPFLKFFGYTILFIIAIRLTINLFLNQLDSFYYVNSHFIDLSFSLIIMLITIGGIIYSKIKKV